LDGALDLAQTVGVLCQVDVLQGPNLITERALRTKIAFLAEKAVAIDHPVCLQVRLPGLVVTDLGGVAHSYLFIGSDISSSSDAEFGTLMNGFGRWHAFVGQVSQERFEAGSDDKLGWDLWIVHTAAFDERDGKNGLIVVHLCFVS